MNKKLFSVLYIGAGIVGLKLANVISDKIWKKKKEESAKLEEETQKVIDNMMADVHRKMEEDVERSIENMFVYTVGVQDIFMRKIEETGPLSRKEAEELKEIKKQEYGPKYLVTVNMYNKNSYEA